MPSTVTRMARPGEGGEHQRRREVHAPVREHAAPGRRGGWTPRPRKTAADCDDDDAGHVEGGHDEPRREGVRQHVAEEDGAVAAPQRDGRLHEFRARGWTGPRPALTRAVDDPGRHADDHDDVCASSAPDTPMTAMASRMKGKASWMSARRMKKSSTLPPK